jgi:hypothetical protein
LGENVIERNDGISDVDRRFTFIVDRPPVDKTFLSAGGDCGAGSMCSSVICCNFVKVDQEF